MSSFHIPMQSLAAAALALAIGISGSTAEARLTSRALPKFESYGMLETAAFRGWKAN